MISNGLIKPRWYEALAGRFYWWRINRYAERCRRTARHVLVLIVFGVGCILIAWFGSLFMSREWAIALAWLVVGLEFGIAIGWLFPLGRKNRPSNSGSEHV
jgi:hypothetical protein